MQFSSTAFTDGGTIPAKYTCDGENTNPPLAWSGVPEGTASLVFIMEDPDVPRNLRPDGLFVHWIAWNIPPSVVSIDERAEPAGVIGENTRGRLGYTGPCPPDRVHRYYFRLYALDVELLVPSTAQKGELLEAMRGHILDQAEIMARYGRPGM